MGFFFFISGYFVDGSYERKGSVAFIRDRAIRLGVPLAFVSIFVFGGINYLETAPKIDFFDFLFFQYIGQWQVQMGPLWFLAQLLALCIIYAVLRKFLLTDKQPNPRVTSVPTNRTVLIYALALGGSGMIVRIYFHQDVWVKILGVIPGEVVHMPQYWSLFVIGIIAGRGQWLDKIPSSMGPKWLAVGLVAFFIALATHPQANLIPSGALPAEMPYGKLWGILWGGLEAFVCVGLIVGFLVLFRRYLATPNRWLERLDQNVFGVYIFHVFILVGVQDALLGYALPALTKFALATILGLIGSFLFAALLRSIPGVKWII